MTQRLTLALVAVALFALLAVMPVPAESNLTQEQIAAIVANMKYVSLDVRLDPDHMPPGSDIPCSGECIEIIQVYNPGDDIEFFGENTDTDKTYLFITGPGLPENGAQILKPDPAHSPVESGNPDTFRQVSVRSDHTWSWTWDTDNTVLADGTYVIYATSGPNGMDNIRKTPAGLKKISIKNSPGSTTSSVTTPTQLITTSPITTRSGNEEAVLPGVVTIIASGDQNYYLGDEIVFTGTNTAAWKTCLFITGPGLAANGSQIHVTDPTHSPVENNNPATFKQMDVQGDHTWSWRWGTSNVALDAGTYTIYAAARPHDKDNLEKTPYSTTSITLMKPLETRATTTTAAPITSPVPPQSPGYGFLIALIGLGSIVFIVVRRH